ncbi:MAG: four-carbon acid sugar kinase family protein [Cyanobacteriota bacterium]|nr:four-carbon acid sugar kinase family protein [Cyanobacteriota bacterium]
MAEHRLKVVVLDDDPTGSQTLHGCPLLLRWDPATLAVGLRQPSPFLFLLANTRALAPDAVAQRVREICRALGPALEAARAEGSLDGALMVSRGDSTLRGHFPLEVETLARELGPVDATFLVPAFLEGGRTTVDGVHRLHGQPVHETPFARDALFPYHTSLLCDWVEEKSEGRLPAAGVRHLGWRELEAAALGDPARQALRDRLADLQGNPLVVVDAEQPAHLALFGALVRELTGPPPPGSGERARRFLFQSAASLLNGLAPLPPQPLAPAALAALRRRDDGGVPRGGLVVVGSHVPLADAQLERLLAQGGCEGVEVPVARMWRVLEGPVPDRLLASLETAWIEQASAVLARGRTPVLHTSRGEWSGRLGGDRRAFGQALAASMARVAAALAPRLGYVISKGGTTTQTLLTEGLGLDWVVLRGQLLPGLSLVVVPDGAGELDGLPVVTFPGNLGAGDTLEAAWRLLEGV